MPEVLSIPIRHRGRSFTMLIDEADLEVIRRSDGQIRYLELKKGYAYFKIYAGKSHRRHPRTGKHLSTQRKIPVARVIMGLQSDDVRVADHINRNRLDNRRSNLRIVTRAENAQNTGAHRGAAGLGASRRTRTSSFRGVSWDSNARRWKGHVRLEGRLAWTGSFQDEAEAAEATAAKRRELMPFTVEDPGAPKIPAASLTKTSVQAKRCAHRIGVPGYGIPTA